MGELSDSESLQKTIADLQMQISRYELSEQKSRGIQHKLDTQIELFQTIHKYTQQAFHATEPDELYSIIVEGIADIFQLEAGAILTLGPSEDSFTLAGSFNIDTPQLIIPFSKEWAQKNRLKDLAKHEIFFESPVTEDSPWAALGLDLAVYVPIICNERSCKGVILGGISESGQKVYDFQPQEMFSSFMVYCQQVNGIYNNYSAMAKVKEANSAKTVFLANLSHEIRTPMNAIIGMAQICRKNDITGILNNEITHIETSSKHLLGLINDVLDITKIEGGKLELENEAFCLRKITDNLLVTLKQTVEDKKQDLAINFITLGSSSFIGDPIRLSQVLLNLLSNAIKFTPESGRIDLNIEELSRDSEKTLIKFSVIDTGIGIPPEFLPRLFSPFEQADNGISRQYGGTGLGLAISQRIIEQMGSVIHVESEIDKGTLFHFSLSLSNGKSANTGKNVDNTPEIPNLSGRTVLVVDDVEINRVIITSLLEETGISIENAENGKVALEMVEKSAVGHFDLILMDVQMPVMDGYVAVQKIRALDRPDVKDIIILAITAHAFKEDIDKALDAGMNGHLSKPVERRVLISTIAAAIR